MNADAKVFQFKTATIILTVDLAATVNTDRVCANSLLENDLKGIFGVHKMTCQSLQTDI